VITAPSTLPLIKAERDDDSHEPPSNGTSRHQVLVP
jgi:hypothetical protein